VQFSRAIHELQNKVLVKIGAAEITEQHHGAAETERA
jgi:hypothetical protein